MAWREKHRVDYVFGLPRNGRLQRKIASSVHEAKHKHQCTGKAAQVLKEPFYGTRKSWSCSRRLVANAEYLEEGENPRYLITSL
jgi:hypothetical protein